MLPDGGLLWAMLAGISVPIWVRLRRLVKRLRLSASGRLLLTIEDMPQRSSESPSDTRPKPESGAREDLQPLTEQPTRKQGEESDEQRSCR